MAKVKINSLPAGYKMANGRVVKTMALGGVPRDTANLEAEKGETVLTDLDNDGAHELYTIGGKRHSEGGTPLNLPPQSFIFSDTAKMKFSPDELAKLGIESKKKQTPAWASKRFKLNEFIKSMDNEHSDNISDETSELMIHKNKLQLSKIAFMSEAKKDFLDEEGNINVPLAAYPFLISKGIEPKEFIAKLEEINAAKIQAQEAPLQNGNPNEQPAPGLQDFTGPPQGPPQQQAMHQMPEGNMMPGESHEAQPEAPQGAPQGGGIQEIIAKVLEALTQGIQPEEIMQGLVQMGIPEEQAVQLLQKVIQDTQGAQGPPQGPPQGQMPPEMMMAMQQQEQGMPPQGMPPEMMPPQGMARYGGGLRQFVYGGNEDGGFVPEPNVAVAESTGIANNNVDIPIADMSGYTKHNNPDLLNKMTYGLFGEKDGYYKTPVKTQETESYTLGTDGPKVIGGNMPFVGTGPQLIGTAAESVYDYFSPEGGAFGDFMGWGNKKHGGGLNKKGHTKPCYECGGGVPKMKMGGDPFTTNPLNRFVYGGTLPKAQNSVETPVAIPHDHDGDGISDHAAADHVGETHGAKGDVAYQCQDVDADGNCISYAEANKTHTDFQDVMQSDDFQYARDVWWDVYEKGRTEQNGLDQPFEGAIEFDRAEGMENYFMYNKILHELDKHDLDPGDGGGDFLKHAQSLGYFPDINPNDDADVETVRNMGKQFQGLYRALNIAKRTEGTKELFTNIETLPQGESWVDENGNPTGEHRDAWGNDVSKIDGKIGKTTKKQYSSAVNPMIPDKQKAPCPGKPLDFDVEAAKIACEKKNALSTEADGTTKGGVTDAYMWNPNNCACEHSSGDFIPPDKVPMIPWVQDQNNLSNAIMDKGLREDFYPMMEQYNFTPADMLRDDPLTRIHASNSLAQTAIDAGADPYKIFGSAANENRKAVSDVQSRDVSEYNALAKANMTGKSAIDQANINARKTYVDDVNAVGTNRINTNIADNANIVTQQNNLITNAQNTQMMNQLRPNYNVDPQATPWNGDDAINFRNARAYNDETGGGGNNNASSMSYQDAYAHAAGAPPEGLGMTPAEANNWAKNYISANRSSNSNNNGYNAPNGRMDGTTAKYGGEGAKCHMCNGKGCNACKHTRRDGAALRKWMRGIK